MSKITDDACAERIKKVEKDAPATKYKVHLKNLELVLSKREYLTLLAGRNWLKKAMARHLELNDADEVTDSMFYREVLVKSCGGMMDAMQHEVMHNIKMTAWAKSLGLDDPKNHRGHDCDLDDTKDDDTKDDDNDNENNNDKRG